jgi:hypothetical protein
MNDDTILHKKNAVCLLKNLAMHDFDYRSNVVKETGRLVFILMLVDIFDYGSGWTTIVIP